jgi:hypothetical protein
MTEQRGARPNRPIRSHALTRVVPDGEKEESMGTTNNESGARDGSKTVGFFLLFIGTVALCISMWMNARFGWACLMTSRIGQR